MLEPLLPKDLTEKDAAFKTVEELHEVIDKALDKGEIKNIALTGPFGSGKSSVLQTLRKRYKEFEYLPISLATLRSEEEESDGEEEVQEGIQENSGQPKGNESKSSNGYSCHKSEKQVEKLNRRIEYSILQQLIYRERTSTVQNSRFRRIVHIEENRLRTYAWFAIGLILAIIVVFFPNFGDVRSLLISYGLGRFLPFLKLSGFAFILYIIYLSVKSFVKSYCNSKLNKLNLKDMYIEIEEEYSIFNKHLDEILYFFQVTKYNVVIIEDLDRFGTSDIFLKLRELNQLINESKIVGRNVVFVYAVKDDMFINEERTKFFDYITTVIPVINPSNSKSKLKEALEKVGVENGVIKDGDLADMAFFIQDMRILTNIVNEFSQYKEKLTEKGQKLNLTKLLAMIVYKNYHPKDFAMLHRREGKVYSGIKAKPLFAKFALNEIELKEKELEKEYQEYLRVRHLKEADLRLLYLYKLKNYCTDDLRKFMIKDSEYSLEAIAENEQLFNMLISTSCINYRYTNYYHNNVSASKNVNLEEINKAMQFKTRMVLLKSGEEEFKKKREEFNLEKLNVHRYKLRKLVADYKQGVDGLYNSLGLSPMMDVFIRRGFIDEEYYDYISFFYEGMLSWSDRELLLSIKRDIPLEYSYHIDKVENFVKELLSYMFESNAILNNDLLDFLAKHSSRYEDNFNLIMYRLETENAPLDFLAQYYALGKEQSKVFKHYVDWDKEQSWNAIDLWHNAEEQNQLREGWLKYSENLGDNSQEWLNQHFDFITERVDSIGLNRCKHLVATGCFKLLNEKNSELLRCVIDNCTYEINVHNLCVITSSLQKENVTPEKLNLSRIVATKYTCFVDFIRNNIVKALPCFSVQCKDETQDSILFLLNNGLLSLEEKKNYLCRQINLLISSEGIKTDELITLAYQLFLITPTWNNVVVYYHCKHKDQDTYIKYIEYYAWRLGKSNFMGSEADCQTLFRDLLGTNLLEIKAYKSIIGSFDKQFDGDERLKNLEIERLKVLLSHSKLPFSDKNTALLKETDAYADYLLFHHLAFFENKQSSYFTKAEVAEKVLSSNKFTLEQKRELVSVIPENILLDSPMLANIVLDILSKSDMSTLKENTIIELLQRADNKGKRVRFVASMIDSFDYDFSKIEELLQILGGKYQEITKAFSRVTLTGNDWNTSLALALSRKGFISYSKSEDGKIRISTKN